MATIANETTRSILGVPGRAFSVVTWSASGSNKNPDAIANQKWASESRAVYSTQWGPGRKIRAEIRFDDNCKNGSQSFAITGEIYRPGARDVEACGCIHDEIARYFPELKPLIQWHLQDQKAPMHYVANAVYQASNRDHWGRLKGEPHGWRYALTFGDNPILHKLKDGFLKFLQEAGAPYDFEVIQLDHDEKKPDGTPRFNPKFTFGGYGAKWHEGPFESELDAVAFLCALQKCDPKFTQYATLYGEGKERNFDAARAAANWPEATDEQLSLPRAELTELLEARLPDLQLRFRESMTHDCGFIWQELPESEPVQ